MKLDNARILVTGGSLGIGKVTAGFLTERGAQVIITGRDEKRLALAAQETGAFPVTADVADESDINRTYKILMEKWGGLDCLINNAGIGSFTPVDSLKLEDFEAVFRVNVFGAALMAQQAISIFKEQNFGNIINIGSTAALKGFEKGSVYSASKFALRGMTQCWQAELRKFNVRVSLVNPSEVATAFANPDRLERDAADNKLRSDEIAHAIVSILEMDDRGFVPELTVWATNPW